MKPRIEDLRTGMVIETENGKYQVLKETSFGDIILHPDFGWRGLTQKYVDTYAISISEPTTQCHIRPINWHTHNIVWKKEEPILTLDGVEYSESTLRSLIKKATSCD